MISLRLWILAWPVAHAISLVSPIAAKAEALDREHCTAADLALDRGFEAMSDTVFVGDDGVRYTRSFVSKSKAYSLTAEEEAIILPMVDEWTKGAAEYVDLWLAGPGSVGRSTKQVMTKDAEAFIAFQRTCLDKFGMDFSK